MRYMLIVKSTSYTEAGVTLKSKYMDAMAIYKNALTQAGVLLTAERLQPSSSGIRIIHPPDGGPLQMQSGPFPVDTELISEFVLIEVSREAEALQWASKLPIPQDQGEWQIEIRRLEEDRDFRLEARTVTMEADLMDQMSILKQIE